MAIISSIIVNRTDSVHEQHTDSQGNVYDIVYFPDGLDVNIQLAAHAARLNASMKQAELDTAVFSGAWDFALHNNTPAELAAYVRQRYKQSSRAEAAQIAARILEWISNGRFTDTQVRNAFGLTAAQWNTLKTKMQNLVAHYQAVEAAEGE